MTRKYVNDRWCARCGKKGATPFVREMLLKHGNFFTNKSTMVDIGCGNGRNSEYFRQMYNTVDSLDMVADYQHGTEFKLGKEEFPQPIYDVVLANYIFMFLNKRERAQVKRQIQSSTDKDSIMLIEMYAAKDAHPYDFKAEFVEYFKKRGWEALVNRKDKCFMRRLK